MKKTTIDGVQYSELKLEKILVNGKEQNGYIVSPEQTKGMHSLNVTLYTQDVSSQPIEFTTTDKDE